LVQELMKTRVSTEESSSSDEHSTEAFWLAEGAENG